MLVLFIYLPHFLVFIVHFLNVQYPTNYLLFLSSLLFYLLFIRSIYPLFNHFVHISTHFGVTLVIHLNICLLIHHLTLLFTLHPSLVSLHQQFL